MQEMNPQFSSSHSLRGRSHIEAAMTKVTRASHMDKVVLAISAVAMMGDGAAVVAVGVSRSIQLQSISELTITVGLEVAGMEGAAIVDPILSRKHLDLMAELKLQYIQQTSSSLMLYMTR